MYALYQNRGADCKTPAETKKITTTATTTTTKRQTGTSGKSKDLKGSPFSLALAVENSDSGSFRPSTESGTNTEQPSRVSETCNARHAATVPPVALQEGSSKYTTGAKSLALASGAHIVREDPSARPGAFSVDGPGSGRTNFERNEAPEATPVTAEAGDDNGEDSQNLMQLIRERILSSTPRAEVLKAGLLFRNKQLHTSSQGHPSRPSTYSGWRYCRNRRWHNIRRWGE